MDGQTALPNPEGSGMIFSAPIPAPEDFRRERVVTRFHHRMSKLCFLASGTGWRPPHHHHQAGFPTPNKNIQIGVASRFEPETNLPATLRQRDKISPHYAIGNLR